MLYLANKLSIEQKYGRFYENCNLFRKQSLVYAKEQKSCVAFFKFIYCWFLFLLCYFLVVRPDKILAIQIQIQINNYLIFCLNEKVSFLIKYLNKYLRNIQSD